MNDDRYGANSKTALFIISGNKTSVGEVLCINNEVSELLGYEKSEVVGHNISKMMPPIIGQRHSEFVMDYIRSGKLCKGGTDRMILALHKLAYMIPCAYIHRVVPSLRQGLQLIGFLYKINDFSEHCPVAEHNTSPDDVVMLLTDQDWAMHAFNLKAAKLFSIDPAQANLRKYVFGEEKIMATKLIPQLEDPSFMQSVNGAMGVAEVSLDLYSIRKTVDAEIEILRPVRQTEDLGLSITPRNGSGERTYSYRTGTIL